MIGKAVYVLLVACAASFALTGQAHAYLDPGTGSMILQALIGGIVGGLFIVRMQWARLKTWFSARFGKPTIVDTPE